MKSVTVVLTAVNKLSKMVISYLAGSTAEYSLIIASDLKPNKHNFNVES